MGNLETLCESTPIQSKPDMRQLTDVVQKQIVSNRTELKGQALRIPISVQKTICFLLKFQDEQGIEKLWDNTKIWKVKSSIFNFCYVNQPIFCQEPPKNKTSIFLYHDKGEFTGFYHGLIDDNGKRMIKQSIEVYENGDYFIGSSTKDNYGKYIEPRQDYDSEGQWDYFYEGDWYNSKPHGKGLQKSNKGTYQGYFFQGVKHGNGKFTFGTAENRFNNQENQQNKNQLVYDGDFKNNQISGQGRLFNAHTGYEYIGEFLKGEKHGLGVQKVHNYIYEGHYHRNKKNGKGKLILYKLDLEYQGFFYDDKPNGKGLLKKTNQQVEGIWKDGKLIAIFERKKL